MRRPLFTAGLLVLTALLAAPAASHGRAFDGMQAWDTPDGNEIARMKQGGVGTFRATISWGGLWRSRNSPPTEGSWGEYDTLMFNAARHRVRVLPTVVGAPPWAAARPSYPPRGRAAMASYLSFMKMFVRRYGRGGSYWRRPGLPFAPQPVTTYQVHNEPGLRSWWAGRPNPRSYARFLRSTVSAIRSVDRRAKIVLAGLPDRARGGIGAPRFLSRLYRVRGAKRLFDVVAIHPYARDSRGVEGALKRARAVMRRNRDSRTPIWITEVGWASRCPCRSAFVKRGEAGQARALRGLYRMLRRKRRRYRVTMVFWFSWRDRVPPAGLRRFWANGTGLFNVDRTPKAAWKTFADFAGGSPGSGRIP